ncbi:MAG TPA: O-antigen ligase family protein [Candidatus Acidoferrales bacterium]|nr:O-antigen ligase family protein [Candidatus Acidoferrales bacterium]
MSETAAYTPATTAAPGQRQVASRSFLIVLVTGLVGVVLAALWLTSHDGLLRVAIPGAAFCLGVVLYLSAPVRYVEYTLWLWFLTPLIRRVVDWRFGYVDPNFVLLAPLIVSGIGGMALLRAGRGQGRPIPAAFVLCGAAILYATVVDVVQHPSAETVYGFADWLCPLLFGLHFYLDADRYEEYRAAVSRTFLLAVPLMGLYGVYQFFAPPAWDRYWLESLYEAQGIASSFGKPEPLMVRVWSTMNAPGPFANIMMVGLLVLLVLRSPFKIPAAVGGYLSLLLSAVRSAWLSWLLGLVLILKTANPRVIARICLSAVALAVCLAPLASDARVAAIVSKRADSFSDLSQDESFQDRTNMYRALLSDALETPFGYGFKDRVDVKGFAIDSGILATLFALGWVGTLLYGAGTLTLCFRLAQQGNTADQFAIVSKAIVIAIVAQVIGGNVFVNATGAMLWLFGGMALAARQQVPEHEREPGYAAS